MFASALRSIPREVENIERHLCYLLNEPSLLSHSSVVFAIGGSLTAADRMGADRRRGLGLSDSRAPAAAHDNWADRCRDQTRGCRGIGSDSEAFVHSVCA